MHRHFLRFSSLKPTATQSNQFLTRLIIQWKESMTVLFYFNKRPL